MNYRKLGRTDLKVSEISLGASGFWGNKCFSEKTASAIVNEAFDRGVNFFDTGHNYSNFKAEPRLGRIVKEILSRNDRSNIIISTKGGTLIGTGQVLPFRHVKTYDYSPDAIELSCSESIKNLNCGYLDIFQLQGMTETWIDGPLVERLLDMKRKGMFRYLGVNTHREAEMLLISQHPEIFDMVLIDYNVVQLDRERIITKLCQAGIGVVAGTVLAQGHLVKGKVGSLKTGSFFWYLARAKLSKNSRRLADNSKKMQDILAAITEMSAPQAAFSYILDNKAIASCVFGTTNINNLIEIIEASGKALSESSKASIREEFDAMTYRISR